MEEAKRIALLEKENFELKEEVDTLFNTVVQLNLKMLQNTWLVQMWTELLLVEHHLKLKASWHCLTL